MCSCGWVCYGYVCVIVFGGVSIIFHVGVGIFCDLSKKCGCVDSRLTGA